MNRFVLAVNAGSSSLKFQLFKMPTENCILSGQFDGINTKKTLFKTNILGQKNSCEIEQCSYEKAVTHLMSFMIDNDVISCADDLELVGHRVAHGGEAFPNSVVIDEQVIDKIDQLSVLAPIHNPINLSCIRVFQNLLPRAKHVAVFDTAFHQTMEPKMFLYSLPYELYSKHGVRRFGFHGISHQYISTVVTEQAAKPEDLKVISCHLGSGASVCAINGGKSVMTSMGFTPLAGLMMGTRCGDIDPAIPSYLINTLGMDAKAVDDMMNIESGLKGVSMLSNDCRVLEEAKANGDEKATLALDMFASRVTQTIGAYAALIGGVDVLAFTGGIGENSPSLRELICQNLSHLGITLDLEKNAKGSDVISDGKSSKKAMVIYTNEELMIAREVIALA